MTLDLTDAETDALVTLLRRAINDDRFPLLPRIQTLKGILGKIRPEPVREQRNAILDGLRAKLAQGDKALVGNSGFRRYLKTVSVEHFAIDETRVAEDARFDGLYVLRTNTKLTPLQVMLRYRDLLRVEQLFRQAEAVLATRPIYQSSDMAIRGHVFCSFLAVFTLRR
jgi:hypothetical protein